MRAWLATLAGGAAALSGTVVYPLLMTGRAELGLSEPAVGLVVTVELAGFALGGLAIARRDAVQARAGLLSAAALLLLGRSLQLGLEPWSLAVGALATGCGAGALAGLLLALAAASPHPDRLQAWSLLGGSTTAFLITTFASGSLALLFTALWGVVVACVVALALAPERPVFTRPGRPAVAARPALAAAWLVMAGESTLWPFALELAQRSGVAPSELAPTLSAAVLAGLGGGGLAVVLAERIRREWLLSGALAGAAGCALVMVVGSSPRLFQAALLTHNALLVFTLPPLLGTIAARDPTGRSNAFAVALMPFGAVVGPLVALTSWWLDVPVGLGLAASGAYAVAWACLRERGRES